MNRPNCIHVPTLLKGWQAKIHWGLVDDADGYILERRFFYEDEAVTEEFEIICDSDYSQGDFLHRGMTWKEIHIAAPTCKEIASAAYSWRRMSTLGKGYSSPHAYFVDFIPEDAIYAEYRVKAYNQAGESKWRGPVKKEVLDHAPADDAIDLDITAGETVDIIVTADKVLRFPPLMQVGYDTGAIDLISVTGRYLDSLNMYNGGAEFAFVYDLPDEIILTAPVALVSFKAVKTGTTTVYMQ